MRIWAVVIVVFFSACRGASNLGNPDTGIVVSDSQHDDQHDDGTADGSLDATGDGPSSDAKVMVPASCQTILTQIKQWTTSHQKCAIDTDCQRLGPPNFPSDHDDFCNQVAAPANDLASLMALTEQWTTDHCGGDSVSCEVLPGTVQCNAGVCVLDVDSADSCATCDDNDLNPHCTTQNHNVTNPCFAKHCFQETIAFPGWCPDSSQCKGIGGTCTETGLYEPPCPEGYRWDFLDPEQSCSIGNVRNFCCVPWSFPCSFVAGSWNINIDPFTCKPPVGNSASMCLFTGDQQSCNVNLTLSTFTTKWDATITGIVQSNNTVSLNGTHNSTGATFTCEGEISFDALSIKTWKCTACPSGSGTPCVTCNAQHHDLCDF